MHSATSDTKTPEQSEQQQSAAYAATRASTRRVLAMIEAEVARHGAAVAISHDEFDAAGIDRAQCSAALRELEALGFIAIAKGANRKNWFTLADGWRAVRSLKDAQRISAMAREPRPSSRPKVYGKPAPKPRAGGTTAPAVNRPETSCARPVTLPALPWPSREWSGD